MFNPGSVDVRRGAANSNKRINQKHQNIIKLYWTSLTGNDRRHQKHAKQQLMDIIRHTAWAFYRKYSDVTPFVITYNFITVTFILEFNFVDLLHATSYSLILVIVYSCRVINLFFGPFRLLLFTAVTHPL